MERRWGADLTLSLPHQQSSHSVLAESWEGCASFDHLLLNRGNSHIISFQHFQDSFLGLRTRSNKKSSSTVSAKNTMKSTYILECVCVQGLFLINTSTG